MSSVVILHNHPIHYQHLLFCALAARGMDFEVLFTARSGQGRLEAPLPVSSEYAYSIGYDGSYENAAATSTARFVWRSLDRIRPAVVILCGYADTAAWTGWLWAGTHGTAKILWAESNAFDHRRHRWKELPKQIFVRNCQLAHTYGISSREYIESLGMPRNRIQIRRAVADTALFLAGDDVEKTGPIRLLYCGRLSPEKNLEMLLRALARLEQNPESPKIVLKLLGHGPLKHHLREIAEKIGIGRTVKFIGSQPQAALPAIFRQSDVLILPSTREPWGLVVNEAMLSGLPVAVSTQCGCVADLVRPDNGWTFSPHDTDGLAKLLAQIADTPREVLRQMGRAGRSLAREYSPENCARAVVNMVDLLLCVPSGRTLAIGAGD